jgi:hypothetical protein
MSILRGCLPLLTCLALWAGTACAQTGEHPAADTKAAPPPLAEFVSPTDSLPHLRFLADGLVSLNDRCPVRKVKLNPRMHAAYVNGRPIGFC